MEIPNFVELEITAHRARHQGNTATNTLKPATVETGAEIRVPLFINEGDKVRIDTRTGEYMEARQLIILPGMAYRRARHFLTNANGGKHYGYGSECKGRLHPRPDDRYGI